MSTAIELISEERTRQIQEEGWSKEHDSTHSNGELALAAVCYALPQANEYISDNMGDVHVVDALWPWDRVWYKPSDDRIRDLVKAGALIVAEIERLSV